MASPMNDGLHMRTDIGTVNYYDNAKCVGTALEKAWASRSGGHSFNILSHEPTKYLRHLRNNDDSDRMLYH
jgi:hypothetical protein